MRFTLLLVGLLFSSSTFAQVDRKIVGTWMGEIVSGSQSFRMVLHLKDDGGTLSCTLDSPDQGALGLPVKGATFANGLLKVDASNLSAAYEGKLLAGDSTVAGRWMQDGVAFPLNLSKQEKAVKLNRPQEPVAPFPYTVQQLTVDNAAGGAALSATLTIPKGAGTFAAVVLLSDTGPHNRDAEVMGHKPFWVMADFLARNGIASIRFDERGVGKSTGNFKAATTNDFASDALAAFRVLYANPKVNKKKVGLLGHGEGAVVAAMVAGAEPKAAFVTLLSGMGIVGEDILLKQARAIARASGMAESAAAEAEELNREMYSIVKTEPDNSQAITQLTDMAWTVANGQPSLSREERSAVVDNISKSFATLLLPWYRGFLVLNPATYLAKVRVPVLALSGAMDLEVSADENLKAIEAALREGGNATFKVLKIDDLNHLLQHCKTGLPNEYGVIEETISPDVLRLVKDWIKNEVGQPAPKK